MPLVLENQAGNEKTGHFFEGCFHCEQGGVALVFIVREINIYAGSAGQ